MTAAGPELRDALIGAVIEGTGGVHYHLRHLVGEGGQGWVYGANYDKPGGFWVVVKILRPECVQGETLERFQREADVLRRLAGMPSPPPNIVRFYDHGTAQIAYPGSMAELPFIVLEHVPGQTLATIIKAHGGFGLPITRVRRLMRHVARGLHAVHTEKIVHRDLKPSNILLEQKDGVEVAKVTDFGLVKLPELAQNRTSAIAGASLGYAPPEQYEMGNNRVTVQTDVFAFASVLFEALSGTEAFLKPGDSPLRVVARMLSGERPSLAKVPATIPRELREQPELTAALDLELARALSADPGVRHRSIRDLWEAVEPLLDRAEGAAKRPGDSQAFRAVVATMQVTPSVPPEELRRATVEIRGERLRAAVIEADRSIVAIGEQGLHRCKGGVWRRLDFDLETKGLRGIVPAPEGDLVLFGDGGLVVRLGADGSIAKSFLGDRDLTLLGAHVDEHGLVVVGERISRKVAVWAFAPRGGGPSLHEIEGVSRLHAATRLTTGSLLLAGAGGALYEAASGKDLRPIPWGRTGHLYALAAGNDGGAFAVGSGGHGLRISPARKFPGLSALAAATLEPVQTTRDLTAVTVGEDGTAWACGGQARLLHRRSAAWARVPLDAGIEARLVAVRATKAGVTVLAENGVVLESSSAEPPGGVPVPSAAPGR